MAKKKTEEQLDGEAFAEGGIKKIAGYMRAKNYADANPDDPKAQQIAQERENHVRETGYKDPTD